MSNLELLKGDIVLKAAESWDGFTYAAVKDRSSDLYHVVIIQKDGTTLRSRPYAFEHETRKAMDRCHNLGYMPDDMEDLYNQPEDHSATKQHPLYGKF